MKLRICSVVTFISLLSPISYLCCIIRSGVIAKRNFKNIIKSSLIFCRWGIPLSDVKAQLNDFYICGLAMDNN